MTGRWEVWFERLRHSRSTKSNALVESTSDTPIAPDTDPLLGHEVPELGSFAGRFLGCMVAGACGDALGSSVEFRNVDQLREEYGEYGIQSYDHRSAPTDDTQMTLFTLEAMIRAHHGKRLGNDIDPVAVLQHAYQRWLHTQHRTWEEGGGVFAESSDPGPGLVQIPGLHRRRAPGNTCLASLESFARTGKMRTFTNKLNGSKGCGGVMRAAPIALWSSDPAEVFRLGAASAALTHSHVSGYLSAGCFAVMVRGLLDGSSLLDATSRAREQLVGWDGHEEQLRALDTAVELAEEGGPPLRDIERVLGGGWVGEEALAIGLYAALVADDLADGLRIAVNHSGDSDSTGAICGNLLGAHRGYTDVPDEFKMIDLADVVVGLSRDALSEFGSTPPTDPSWSEKYPPT